MSYIKYTRSSFSSVILSFASFSASGLIVHEGAAVYSVFLRWRAVNLHWDVQSYDKAKDMEEASAAHSSLAPRTLWLPLVSFRPDGSLQATQLGSRSWTRLCLGSFCPRTNPGQENDSGEVVIRITSVWGDTWCASPGALWDFTPFLGLTIFPLGWWNLSSLGPVLKRSHLNKLLDFFLQKHQNVLS